MSNSTLTYGYDWSDGASYPTNDEGGQIAQLAVAVLGTFSNFVLLLAIALDKKTRTSQSGLFIIGLGVTDFCWCLVLAITVSQCIGEYKIGLGGCIFQAFCTHFFASTSILLLALVAGERYYKIVKGKTMKIKHSKYGIVAMYAVGFVYAVFPFMGFGHYDLQPSGNFCWGRGGFGILADDLYCALSVIVILASYIGLPVAYSRIFAHIHKVFTKTSGRSKNNDAQNAEVAIMKQFIIITGFFLICWTMVLLKFTTEAAQMPILVGWYDNIGGNMATCSSAFNPLIYGIMNKKIRGLMLGLFGMKSSSSAKVSSAVTVNSDEST
ncbi:hypothetical protein TrST_g2207 [Triparma strigata]|uniref:G-protein coupled receptors family 1 profile domain-containing protein n=1 Tax=Triparma strigata TaxID=1606541 RepID=A0A9W7EU40_9STRA|nr:hypothetical protein TrST_g2207 [Triparma strigata]